MNNKQKFDDVAHDTSAMTTAQRAGAFSYLTGALRVLLETNTIDAAKIVNAYEDAKDYGIKSYPKN
jgi:hypothetical protein